MLLSNRKKKNDLSKMCSLATGLTLKCLVHLVSNISKKRYWIK